MSGGFQINFGGDSVVAAGKKDAPVVDIFGGGGGGGAGPVLDVFGTGAAAQGPVVDIFGGGGGASKQDGAAALNLFGSPVPAGPVVRCRGDVLLSGLVVVLL